MSRFSALLMLCVVTTLALLATAKAASMLHYDDGIDTPTAYVSPHGTLALGGGAVFEQGSEFPRQEALLSVDLMLLDRLTLGLNNVRFRDDSWLSLNVKFQVVEEFQARPAFAIGVDQIGDAVPHPENDMVMRYHPRSPYGVLSKRFTLPTLQQFSIHLGWGDRRYRPEETFADWTNGMFIGIDKVWYPGPLRGALKWHLEFNAYGVHAGLRYRLDSGAGLQLAARLGGEGVAQYWFGLEWSNAPIRAAIEEAKNLARSAARLAVSQQQERTSTHE